MKTFSPLCTFLCLLLALVHSPAQGVIGGNQNGLGPGGYLPKPIPLPALRSQIVTSLSLPGYEFDLVQFGGSGSVQVVVDPQQPIIVPLLAAHAVGKIISPEPLVPIIPTFVATFNLVNSTPAARTFEFPWQYWADNKIVFSLLDSTGAEVWRSVPLPVDKPPLAQPVSLTLGARKAWRQSVAVPLSINGALLADGQYRLQAALTGTPEYSASAPISVKNVVGGPIVDPLPGTGVKGLAQVSPVSPVERPGVLNAKPLPGAIIQIDEVGIPGVLYFRALFSGQAVADQQGRFSLATPAGKFTVTGLPPTPDAKFPLGSTQTVEVKLGSYSDVVVNYDSGIR